MTTPISRLGTLLFAVFVTVSSPAWGQSPARIGTVVQQFGSVTVLRGTEPAALRLGAPIFEGDRVITGADSRIRIELTDRSVLAIGAGTDIALTEQVSDAGGNPIRNAVSLLYGIVRATVLSVGPRQSFDIETQSAIVSARSTDWLVEAGPDRSAAFVVDGEVAVTARSGGSVLLTPGLGTDVIGDAPPTAPVAWPTDRRDAALARVQIP